MRRTRRADARMVLIGALGVVGLLAWQTSAMAVPDPMTSEIPATTGEAVTSPAGGSNDDEGSSDSEEGGSSASSYGQVFDLDVGGNDVVTVGHSSSSSSSSDGSSADATVLAIGGQELWGAHSESHNSSDSDEVGLLLESCEMTSGQICLGLLYGYAATSDDGDSSISSSDTAAADACLGGSDADRRATDSCSGPVSLSLLDSHSDSSADGDGAQTSESSNGAVLCIGGQTEDGVCKGIGLRVLHSESSASAGPDGSDGDGESYVLGIEQDGESQTFVGDEAHVDVPPGCPDGGSVACAALNEGGADAESGSNSQTLLSVDVAPDEEGDAGNGDAFDGATEAGADSDADTPDDGDDDVVESDDPQQRDPVALPAPGAQPFTGGAVMLFIVLAIIAIVAGAALVNASRRGARKPL